jgi:hypothetical protein
MGQKRNTYTALVGKHEGKRPIGRPRHAWEYNIKCILKKQDGRTDWIHLAQNKGKWQAVVTMVMKLWSF